MPEISTFKKRLLAIPDLEIQMTPRVNYILLDVATTTPDDVTTTLDITSEFTKPEREQGPK